MNEPTAPQVRVPDHALGHAPPSPVNRVLGATSGDASGNVRALLAVAAMLCLHVLFGVLLWAYTHGSPELKDFLLTWGAAMLGLDISAVQFYFGKRSGEGA